MDEAPCLNIIYDARRFEKYEPLIAELKRQHVLDYEIWPCLMMKDVVTSINKSHKMIVEQAKKDGLKEVAIAEDDLMFSAEDGWQHFLRNKPQEYDLYIGGSYLLDSEIKWATPSTKVKHHVGNHLYMVHEKYYDTFLSVPDSDHIDTIQSGRGDFYVCFPFAALQRPGFSSNNKAMSNYNSIFVGMEDHVYGGLPK